MARMHALAGFFHVAAAIFWMGGMAFMVLALRPALAQLEPPLRLPLVASVLRRFFAVVGISIAVLALTGVWLYLDAELRPRGWHAMAGIGLVMALVFGHIFFAPYRRLKHAVAGQAWADAGRAAAQVSSLAKVNLGLGWIAIAAVMLWR